MTTLNNGVGIIQATPQDKKRTAAFSYYDPPITNTEPFNEMTVDDLVKTVKSDSLKGHTDLYRSIQDPKEARKAKSKIFPYVTFNGTFSKRSDDHFISPSGLFVLDIDNQGKLEAIFSRLIDDPILNPIFIFRSPSGRGLKVIVMIDPTLIDLEAKSKKMHRIWEAINNYLSRNYKDIIEPDDQGNYIDESGKDLSRSCFICRDPSCFYNENSTTPLAKDFIKQYGSLKVASVGTTESKPVSPKTNMDVLRKRHCLLTDNHHDQVIKFISAARAIGENRETILRYIENHIHISPVSVESDPERLKYTVDDICKRYHPTDIQKISAEVVEGIREAIKLTDLSYAYDIFYFKYSKDADGFILSGLYYEGIKQLLRRLGYYKKYLNPRCSTLIKEDGPVISLASTENLRDVVTRYVDELKEGFSFTYQDCAYVIPPEALREIYLRQSNNLFNETWLEHMEAHTIPVLKDTATEIFIPFKNCVIAITREGVGVKQFSELGGYCIWDTQLNKRELQYIPDSATNNRCHFAKFLKNVTNEEPNRYWALVTAIGYLMHHYFRPSEGEAVILYDEAITDAKRPMGGTGKGLIANALREIRALVKIDGKHFDVTNRFRWEMVSPSTQIVWLDDVRPDFDFSTLHSTLTDGWTVERKHSPQIFIEPKDSPKTLICSNSILANEGTTNARRQLAYELSDYYSSKIKKGKKGPIETEHGCVFFSDDWTDEEWNLFYSFMSDCAGFYLKDGRVPHPEVNVAENRLRQKTNEDFVTWIKEQHFALNKRYKTKDHFNQFVGIYYGEQNRFTQRTFTTWLKMFGESKGWTMDIIPSNGEQYFMFRGTSG